MNQYAYSENVGGGLCAWDEGSEVREDDGPTKRQQEGGREGGREEQQSLGGWSQEI